VSWRLAKAAAALRNQVNAAWPKRSKTDDGTIGDAAHSARSSDHNPNASGVVCAIDITDDPKSGCDVRALFDRIKGDRRVHYVIHERRMSHEGGPWIDYHGTNPHTAHGHLSLKQSASTYDNAGPWNIQGAPAVPKPPKPAPKPHTHPTVQRGSQGAAVAHLQARLIAHGWGLKPDGDFGAITESVVRKFQKGHGLTVDGIVGPDTWRHLG
jgi:hypothetical protein